MTLTFPPPTAGSRVEKLRRKRARKIKSELGPFDTAAFGFDRGERSIEIVRITPAAIVYRLKGFSDEYTLPHGIAFGKAISLATGTDTAPREGRIRRGT